MVIQAFPPLESADESGLIAVGGDLSVETLLNAYRSAIFPWPLDEHLLTWFSPPLRALLFLDDYHTSRSLKRDIKKLGYRCTFNQRFGEVTELCAELKNRRAQRGTWITEDIRAAYLGLHAAGHAHSVETWCGDELVGGLYGVSVGGMFAGESMFYRKPSASKAALDFLITNLREQGVPWIDCQVMTPLFESLGAKEITRQEFVPLLQREVKKKSLRFPNS